MSFSEPSTTITSLQLTKQMGKLVENIIRMHVFVVKYWNFGCGHYCCYTGAIIGPVVVGIIVIGNSAVLLGLWPAHFFWTYFCVAKYTTSLCSCPPTLNFKFPVFCLFISFFVSFAPIQNQKAWMGFENTGTGVTASAFGPLAAHRDCWKHIGRTWLWVLCPSYCNFWGCWGERHRQILPLLCR